MPKPMYVWTGTAWVSVASEVESLATYATQSYADNTPGMRMIIPASVSVGSGSGSVSTSGAVTFSGASSVSINTCFSSTYDDYLIVGSKCSTSVNATDVKLNYRANTTDNANAQYSYGRSYLDFSGTGFGTGGGSTTGNATFGIAAHLGTSPGSFTLHIGNPFTSNQTSAFGMSISLANYGYLTTQYTTQKESTSFNGFTLTPSSGTITGNIRIYGLKN